MVKKINACVFISGNGSNLKSIIKNSLNKNFPIKIGLVITNKENANGLKYAKKYNIPFKFYNSRNQLLFEKNCLLELKKKKNKIYMPSWIHENFVQKFYL